MASDPDVSMPAKKKKGKIFSVQTRLRGSDLSHSDLNQVRETLLDNKRNKR